MSDQLNKRLLEDVVIFAGAQETRTGARLGAPDHSPREEYKAGRLPAKSALLTDGAVAAAHEIQGRVEQFLYYQAELLDTKSWQAYLELFAEDGVYWMPASAEHTELLDSSSIFAEDRQLMTVRM